MLLNENTFPREIDAQRKVVYSKEDFKTEDNKSSSYLNNKMEEEKE